MSNKINIKFMSDEAIETLRGSINTVSDYMVNNPQDSSWLSDLYKGELFITKKYEIDDFVLKIPQNSKDKTIDFENSIILYEHLKTLPKYILTDERFWSWINFEKGYQVAQIYMPVNEGKSVFKDHWLFTQGKRRGLFFGVLSRCFFRVELTVDPTLEDKYEYTRFVIDNPERFRNLSWRSFSGEKKIVLGTLKAEKRILDEFKIAEKSDYYTELAKEISKLGSVMLLDAMTETDIEEFVYTKFKSIIEQELEEQSAAQTGNSI